MKSFRNTKSFTAALFASSVLLSGAAFADEPANNPQQTQQEQGLLDKLFSIQYFECDTYPDCDIDESEKMLRDAEKEQEVYKLMQEEADTSSDKGE